MSKEPNKMHNKTETMIAFPLPPKIIKIDCGSQKRERLQIDRHILSSTNTLPAVFTSLGLI